MGSIIDNSTTESESMSAELSVLCMLQYEALQKSPYLRMSEKEAEVYDRRRMRISDLCDRLGQLRESTR